MNSRLLKRLLVISSFLGFVLAIGVVVTNALVPLQVPVVDVRDRTMDPARDRPRKLDQPAPSLEEFESVWSKSLYDRPAIDSIVEDDSSDDSFVDASSRSIVLLGTIVEPGRSFAIIRQVNADVEVLGEGQSVRLLGEQFEVVKIMPRRVTVRHNGQLVELKIEEENQI